MGLAIELVAAVGLVLACMAFSGTEVALFSLRRVDREQMSRSGKSADARVLWLLARPRRMIATVLIGDDAVKAALVMVAMSLVGAYGTLALGGDWIHEILAGAGVLFVVVLLGEVLPKALALRAPGAWARAAAWPLTLFYVAITPVRFLVQGTGDLILKAIGVGGRPKAEKDLSEEEFRSLLEAGSAHGQVDQRERRLIHRVLDFSDKNVGQVMTPRDKIFAVSYELPMARLAKEVVGRGFSRVPIYQKSLDNIRGVLSVKDLVRVATGTVAGPGGRTLGELLHEPLFLPRTTPIKRAFFLFKEKKVHMGIVVNEYGGVLGLVTLDDVLAQLFGALRDEREAVQASAGRGRGGRTPLPGALSRAATPVPVAPAEVEPQAEVSEVPAPAPATADAGDGVAVSDGAPVPITHADTGPSGPVRSAAEGGS